MTRGRDDSRVHNDRVRNVMLGNRSRDTKPELEIRSRVHALGLRYRVDARPEPSIPRKADLVFTRAKVAVFVDGCFWHGCPEHYVASKTNVGYWLPKITANVARDKNTNSGLTAAGWFVIRVWSHEDPGNAALQIQQAVTTRLARLNKPASQTNG